MAGNSLFEQDISPKSAKGNIALIAVNVFVFLLSDFFDVRVNGEYLIDAGDLSWVSVLRDGQYYRVISSMFLHLDTEHIFSNMLTLGVVGTYLEMQLGTLRYLAVYFCSGIIAGCTSMGYNMMLGSEIPSIGASGAVFGVVGGLVCMVIMKRHQVSSYDIRRLIFMVFVSLYCGYASEGVDNSAHVGGFVSGFLITGLIMFLMGLTKKKRQCRERRGMWD